MPGNDLLDHRFQPVPFKGSANSFDLECLANRDSLAYLSEYTLPQDLSTMFRGTLRYSGFSFLLSQLKTLGLLDRRPLEPREVEVVQDWSDLLRIALSRTMGRQDLKSEWLENAFVDVFGKEVAQEIASDLQWRVQSRESGIRPRSLTFKKCYT
jgi:alpha-aminoadipic semialdehyde synthase